MVYIDTPTKTSKGVFSHLIADSILELHIFAGRNDIHRAWFNNKRGKNEPHYDVKGEDYQRLVDDGAKPISNVDLFRKVHQIYGGKQTKVFGNKH